MHKNDIDPAPELCDVPCFDEEVVRRVRLSSPDAESLERVRSVFALMADRKRLLILHALLEGGELCVCDLAHVLNSSVAATSHHLQRLRGLDLVEARRDGRMVLYSVGRRWAAEMGRAALGEVQAEPALGRP